jgi:membrane fusion protein, multidrug efflux system
MKKTIIISIIVIIIALIIYRLVSVYSSNSTKKETFATQTDVAVNVSTVKMMSSEKTLNLVGTLSTDKELNISAETQGKITYLNCEVGQYKQQGSVIATIDDKLKVLAVESAKINLSKVNKDLERIKILFDGGTSTEQELDNAKTNYEAAVNSLEQSEKQLTYTKILAPISGTITEKKCEVGAYVNTGSAIGYIVNISKLKVKINVSESSVYLIKVGDNTYITTDVYPGVTFSGKISYISPTGDESHNYPVEVEIENNSKHPLKAGTFVNVKIDISSSGNKLFIPREALQGSVKDAQIFVAENNIAKLKKIVIGSQNNDYLEVLSGLNEGEQVITSGQVNLSDNKPIKIINNN